MKLKLFPLPDNNLEKFVEKSPQELVQLVIN
jgi:hypothetical protein